jgi:4-hydroxythreonine-4-phosphate dehydrogenase
MNPFLITSGEPAGIGPDVCLQLAGYPIPLVVLGDVDVLRARAEQCQLNVHFRSYLSSETVVPEPGTLWVWHVPVNAPVVAGRLDPTNSAYVLRLIDLGIEACLSKQFSALVTAPINKAVMNDAGMPFSGHTDYLAQVCGVDNVVMLLTCEAMRVALVTTHIPLAEVAKAITFERVSQVIEQVYKGMQTQFGLAHPRLWVAGLNPHAGEAGHLGREEIEVITPVIESFQKQGYHVNGPVPADTLFTPPYLQQADALIAMYHDQGLSVLKYAGFGHAVNMTLGLPFIRTSVDHGTALSIAGTGKASASSLFAAVDLALKLVTVKA